MAAWCQAAAAVAAAAAAAVAAERVFWWSALCGRVILASGTNRHGAGPGWSALLELPRHLAFKRVAP